ncbi:MAG: DUF1491 family protein [Alphaproteobacteria bacterium]|nr:DUF1491 family protein [Alphaproteobacteria bacterium]
MARLRSDLVIAAILRRAQSAGATAVLRRRGVGEAGAIFISVDYVDGRLDLYGPAPPRIDESAEDTRRFDRILIDASGLDLSERMAREVKFDPDLWWVEIEDRQGRYFAE